MLLKLEIFTIVQDDLSNFAFCQLCCLNIARLFEFEINYDLFLIFCIHYTSCLIFHILIYINNLVN